MNIDLITTLKLLHKVLGFLVQQAPEHLRDIAEGQKTLSLAQPETISHREPEVPATLPENVPSNGSSNQPEPRKSRTRTAEDHETDFTAVAARLRNFSSIEQGAEYLAGLKANGRRITKSSLVRIGAEMGLTLREGEGWGQLQQRLVNHAIGAKKKYAGLTKW
ncbi:hypothetical protein [Actinoplanes sp. NPDC020271]|uniref:hypothetical protein n=1 Tax=Actinoplanes sp. NPDC020271 TaxID=3363896 RepID=UPI0037B4306C